MDDPRLLGYNLEDKIHDFINASKIWSAPYRTENVMMTMGSDFQYLSARAWYDNLDKLIRWVSAAMLAAPTGDDRTDDFVCAAMWMHAKQVSIRMWTCSTLLHLATYKRFTTRGWPGQPNRMISSRTQATRMHSGQGTSRPDQPWNITSIKQTSSFKHASNWRQSLMDRRKHWKECLSWRSLLQWLSTTTLWQAPLSSMWLTITRWDSALASTRVSEWSVRRSCELFDSILVISWDSWLKFVYHSHRSFQYKTHKNLDDNITLDLENFQNSIDFNPGDVSFCHNLNISSCYASESMNDFVLSVYNPLARYLNNTNVRVPVTTPHWKVVVIGEEAGTITAGDRFVSSTVYTFSFQMKFQSKSLTSPSPYSRIQEEKVARHTLKLYSQFQGWHPWLWHNFTWYDREPTPENHHQNREPKSPRLTHTSSLKAATFGFKIPRLEVIIQ